MAHIKKLVQNHPKRLLIINLSDPFKEIVVAESNSCTEINFRLTLVAMVMNFVTKLLHKVRGFFHQTGGFWDQAI